MSVLKGRVAILAHPGDVVVMAGGPLRSHGRGAHRVIGWLGFIRNIGTAVAASMVPK